MYFLYEGIFHIDLSQVVEKGFPYIFDLCIVLHCAVGLKEMSVNAMESKIIT